MSTPLQLHRNYPPQGRLDPGTVVGPAPDRMAPVRHAPLPITGAHPPLFAVLGAHGGAGASTLAQWWAPAADTGLAWPASPRTTQRVLIAARLCMTGLTAAAERLREWHGGYAPDGITVIGLTLTAARPGSVPSAVRRYRSVVAELVDDIYDIGWHDELVALERSELARYNPRDPTPQRHRRSRLTESVPHDVYQAGANILSRLAASHTSAQQESEDQP
ncbi:hypothetical protein [Nocardia iowensis]|uniref:Uncharacterized protein n=1 Tax=Nocardia iowensis TaxID=204891 RepID=A0ABX8RY38_NOCIO|nr:hypothetical protein [Nocardia iowensis]QXN94578.1 hypothetical protein KV110_16920 [Nocardia iowensis]